MPRCRYCSIYCTTRNRKTEKEKDEVTGRTITRHFRHCPYEATYVMGSRKACDEFIPYQWFFCDKEENWMNILACMGRQDREYGECDCCFQGREILSVIRQMRKQQKEMAEEDDTPKEPPPKKKILVKRTKRLVKRSG